MQRIELLTIQDRFQLRLGVVLLPDFPVPVGRWRNLEELVLVVTPEGHEFEVLAQFNVVRFNIRDSMVSIDQRYRLVVSLQAIEKEQVPIGSRVFVSQAVHSAVLLGVVE